ncbi:hypothetical protein [Paenibacillus sp. yr247]|uniref:hypothetical protein n=1 Tax=Paenibacillus sp. yr247 TaxID=1761880 RepID=UPI0015871BBE|nr:hypothetical protein [Paenibacillus sp. yr247]
MDQADTAVMSWNLAPGVFGASIALFNLTLGFVLKKRSKTKTKRKGLLVSF